MNDPQAFHQIISKKENRYIARQLCWILTVEGIETYILRPSDPADLELLVEAVRPVPSRSDVDLVVGIRGPLAPPELCNGLVIPMVFFDQVYSFDRESLIRAIPKPEKVSPGQFEADASVLFDRVQQIADNAGATDEHRALNYLAVRYPRIYEAVAAFHGENLSLTGIEVRPSRLSGVRKVFDVIFTATHRQTDVQEKMFVRVDVTEEFPFLVTKIQPFFDRT